MKLDWKKILLVVIVLILVLMLTSRFLVGGVLFSPEDSESFEGYNNYFWLIVGLLALCLFVLSGLIAKSLIKQRKEEAQDSEENKESEKLD